MTLAHTMKGATLSGIVRPHWPATRLRRSGAGMAALACLGALLTGCASPGQLPPGARAVRPAELGLAASAAEFPRSDWWTQFNDPTLNRLIQQALADNPTLQEAQARMREAQAAAGVAQASLEPKLGAALNSTRQRFSEHDFYGPPLAGGVYTESQALLQGSYEIDFFGRNRAELEAAVGQARAAEAQAQAARVLLAANVAGSYFNLARLAAQREVLERTLRQRQDMERMVSDRVRAGLDTALQQRQAQAEIPQIRLQIEQVAQGSAEVRHGLAALLGQGPQAAEDLAPDLRALPLPEPPRLLPAELIGHRADVVAARWQAQAELAGVEAARAAFYPNISLTAFAGLAALDLAKFLAIGSRTYGAGPALTLPIFDGGRLRANLRGRSAAADAAIERYNAAVVNAVREVADALGNRRSLEQQIAQQQAALKLAHEAYDLARQRYRAGLGNYLNVLAIETSVLQLEQVGAGLKAQALIDEVALIRALGGGYAAEQVPSLPERPAGAAAPAPAAPPNTAAARP